MADQYVFYVRVKLVGSYLPIDGSVFHDLLLIDDKVEDVDWIKGPTGLNADPSDNSTGITIRHDIEIKNGAVVYLKINSDTSSAKQVYIEAHGQAKKLISILSLTTLGGRYYYELDGVKMLPRGDSKYPHESPPSQSVFGASYTRRDIEQAQISMLKELGDKANQDRTLEKLLEYFHNALSAEYQSGFLDEKAILYYFKIIELVSGKMSRKFKASKTDKKKLYRDTIDRLLLAISKVENLDDKLKVLRRTTSEIRIIDDSIISEKIKKTAHLFDFNPQAMSILNNLIDMRNKIIVHPNMEYKVELNDKRHYREMSKVFILEYCKRMLGVKIGDIDKRPSSHEISGWYRVTYTRSTS